MICKYGENQELVYREHCSSHNLHKKLALTSCKNITDFVLFYHVTKTVEKKNGETVEKRKKVQGVYVLYGSELVFKEISITYSTSQYVLCNPTPEEGVLFNGKTVQLYDQVVIKGDNLYDGKVVA